MTNRSVSIVVLTWNSRRHIDTCLNSLLDQDFDNFQVCVYDSCSSDDTVDYVKTHFPQVALTKFDSNLGYRRGNAAAMRQLKSDYIVICNDDIKVERAWLHELVTALEEDPVAGMATPMILDANIPQLVNAAGNTLNFTGMYGPRGKGEPRSLHEQKCVLAAVSGCCFIVRSSLVAQLGGFSSDFDAFDVGWHASFEDVDFGWRLQLLGYTIKYVPTSVMYHYYSQQLIRPSWFASYEWGRYVTVLRNYQAVTLLFLLPLLIALEVSTWLYSILKGKAYIRAKASVMWWLATHVSTVMSMRQDIQETRRASDVSILLRMSSTIGIGRQLGGSWLAQFADKLLAAVMIVYKGMLLAILSVLKPDQQGYGSTQALKEHKGKPA